MKADELLQKLNKLDEMQGNSSYHGTPFYIRWAGRIMQYRLNLILQFKKGIEKDSYETGWYEGSNGMPNLYKELI